MLITCDNLMTEVPVDVVDSQIDDSVNPMHIAGGILFVGCVAFGAYKLVKEYSAKQGDEQTNGEQTLGQQTEFKSGNKEEEHSGDNDQNSENLGSQKSSGSDNNGLGGKKPSVNDNNGLGGKKSSGNNSQNTQDLGSQKPSVNDNNGLGGKKSSGSNKDQEVKPAKPEVKPAKPEVEPMQEPKREDPIEKFNKLDDIGKFKALFNSLQISTGDFTAYATVEFNAINEAKVTMNCYFRERTLKIYNNIHCENKGKNKDDGYFKDNLKILNDGLLTLKILDDSNNLCSQEDLENKFRDFGSYILEKLTLSKVIKCEDFNELFDDNKRVVVDLFNLVVFVKKMDAKFSSLPNEQEFAEKLYYLKYPNLKSNLDLFKSLELPKSTDKKPGSPSVSVVESINEENHNENFKKLFAGCSYLKENTPWGGSTEKINLSYYNSKTHYNPKTQMYFEINGVGCFTSKLKSMTISNDEIAKLNDNLFDFKLQLDSTGELSKESYLALEEFMKIVFDEMRELNNVALDDFDKLSVKRRKLIINLFNLVIFCDKVAFPKDIKVDYVKYEFDYIKEYELGLIDYELESSSEIISSDGEDGNYEKGSIEYFEELFNSIAYESRGNTIYLDYRFIDSLDTYGENKGKSMLSVSFNEIKHSSDIKSLNNNLLTFKILDNDGGLLADEKLSEIFKELHLKVIEIVKRNDKSELKFEEFKELNDDSKKCIIDIINISIYINAMTRKIDPKWEYLVYPNLRFHKQLFGNKLSAAKLFGKEAPDNLGGSSIELAKQAEEQKREAELVKQAADLKVQQEADARLKENQATEAARLKAEEDERKRKEDELARAADLKTQQEELKRKAEEERKRKEAKDKLEDLKNRTIFNSINVDNINSITVGKSAENYNLVISIFDVQSGLFFDRIYAYRYNTFETWIVKQDNSQIMQPYFDALCRFMVVKDYSEIINSFKNSLDKLGIQGSFNKNENFNYSNKSIRELRLEDKKYLVDFINIMIALDLMSANYSSVSGINFSEKDFFFASDVAKIDDKEFLNYDNLSEIRSVFTANDLSGFEIIFSNNTKMEFSFVSLSLKEVNQDQLNILNTLLLSTPRLNAVNLGGILKHNIEPFRKNKLSIYFHLGKWKCKVNSSSIIDDMSKINQYVKLFYDVMNISIALYNSNQKNKSQPFIKYVAK